jgi:hypothetical protein
MSPERQISKPLTLDGPVHIMQALTVESTVRFNADGSPVGV